MSMNFSEFDSTDSERSMDESLDKEQLKKALQSGEERLQQTNLLLERAKETIKSLQNGVGTSPIRSARRGLEASSLTSSFADSSVSGDSSMSAIQNQLNFITSQMQNLPPKQNTQFIKLKERNTLIEKQLSELQEEFQIKNQDYERLELEYRQLKTMMGTTDSENQILKDNIRRLQDQVAGYQKTVNDLSNENNSLSERIDELEEKERSELSSKLGQVNQLKKEIDKLNVLKLDLENKLTSQQSDFELKFNTAKKSFDIEKVELKSDYDKRLSNIKVENSNVIKMLQDEIDGLQEEKKQMIQSFNSEKMELSQKFNEEKKQLLEKQNEERKQLFEKSSVDKHSVNSETLQDSDEKIVQFLQNVFVPSDKHEDMIESLKKKHTQMKKILQMEYWTNVRKLRLKPNSSVSKVPKAKKAFSNAIDRMDVHFMSQVSTLTMSEDTRDFNVKDLEKMYEGEVSRARSFVSTITSDSNDRLLTQQEFAIESTKEYVQEQERQLSSLSDAVRRIDLQSDKQNEKNLLKQCLLQIESLYKEDKNTIRSKMFKAINESNNSSGDVSKLAELVFMREEQLSKFLDIQSSLLSTSLSNLMNSREEKILEKLQARLKDFCKVVGQSDEIPKSENDLMKKLKELVDTTESRIKSLEGELKSKKIHASRQVNDQLPMSIQRWMNGDDDSESDGDLTPRKRGSRGVDVASPIKPSKNSDDNWTPHPLRHKTVGFDDPNFYFVSNNDERISLDIDDKEERFISSPLAKKLETRYKAILTALRDDILRVKSISDVIPKVRSILEHNAQMYSFIFSLINVTNYSGDKKFGYFLLDGEKVIDLDGLYLDIIWYRRLYEKLKKELVTAEETEQSPLYFKMKAAIVELKKQTKVFGNNHEANEEREVISKLKRTLNVQFTHQIVEECETIVSQLEKYVRIFPKFQSLINELCIGLNVKRIEDVIPSVKRLVKMSKNVNLLL
ncbi:predicted protein [Naegleria gruberi]|uniref:Predicted protein n=1 Tax=Naegleria gruberi TaxID=5762 RepID=D2VGF4_NAEGR|nr:uncharacterized protein NAEGRDRAFT_67957 [Naegleria gruberi]EFC44053.1 predicted protein [Naegleria gruberi]|eukprot:XP_002676797.1 predicted protein [Naegleria gruberi strain NEG-M]